jgi:hypothetical protein
MNGERCDPCRGVLRALYSQQCKTTTESTQKRTEISSHTNYRYLNTEEKDERMRNLKAEVIRSRKEIQQLKEKISAMHQQKGVEIDDLLQEDMESIMAEMNDEVQKSNADDSFKKLF